MTSPQNVRAFRRSLLRWFHRYARDLPWRDTRDPYAILVSEFMLQQTQVATVTPYYNEWLRRFPDFVSLARASEHDVLHSWQGLGYYARARNLRATARGIVNRHSGRFPRSIKQMLEFPGIGKYTAHAIASFAFNQSVPIIEANTARVLTRLFNLREPIDCHGGRKILWERAATLVPKSNGKVYNSALLDLGALICVPRAPKCGICPVKTYCRAQNPAALPIKRPIPPTKRIVEKHAFIVKRGRVLLEQSRARWRGMWIFPPLKAENSSKWSLRRLVHKSVFPFTHYRVTMLVYRSRVPKRIAPGQRWFKSIDHVAMPSPHRQAAQSLPYCTNHASRAQHR